MPAKRDFAARAKAFLADQSGATATEYGLIIFVVSLAIGFALPSLGDSIQQVFLATSSQINAKVR